MYKPYLLALWVVCAGMSMAADDEAGSEYRNWCSHSADAEQLSGSEREDHIRECMNSLAEADRNPDRTERKGEREGDDDG